MNEVKKPKIERDEEGEKDKEGGNSREEQEEALVALIEHRTSVVQQLQRRIVYYQAQLEEELSKLQDSESKLARLRRGDNAASLRSTLDSGIRKAKDESGQSSPLHVNGNPSRIHPKSKPELLIPGVAPKIIQPVKTVDSSKKALTASGIRGNSPASPQSGNAGKLKRDECDIDQEVTEHKDKGSKRKFEQKEHTELIPLLRSSSSPHLIRCHASSHISSQHKRKLRSLALCPVNDQLFITSALDGVVNLWQIQARGSSATFLSSTDCISPKQRRWPEDIAWHPEGNSLFSVYSADSGDSQVSILNLNKAQGKGRVTFLSEKPHVKGIINNIVFMPWEDTCFITGGSDHAVVLWSEKSGENSWKPKALHRTMHTSAVMGVAGMQQKAIVLSAGADKRIIGFDIMTGRADFKHQIDTKCMSVLPNPCDFNLFMVQTGTHERQLRLFDIRLRQTELHAFGWKQESSESQSALINQAWSPDGLYLTSGSADPVIHIFDIRYNAHKPAQSVQAHQKRVFKAVWHSYLQLLISISSDLNIGLHKITQ